MCGIGSVGMPPTLAGTPTPVSGGGATSTAVPTGVAGATGGGGLESLSPLLEQVAAAVQALTAALGSQALGGGGAEAGAAKCQMPGMDDAIGGGPGQIGQEPPVPTEVPAPPAGDKHKSEKNGNGKGGDAGPEQAGEGKSKGKSKGKRKPEGNGKGGDAGPEQRGGPDKPKRNKPQKPNGGGNGGGTGGVEGSPPPPPPKDPNGPRRMELRQDIREAKAELKRITDKMDRLAAERERLESTTPSTPTAADHKIERLNEIRSEINALRSAGGYISSSLPIMQAELDKLPPPPK